MTRNLTQLDVQRLLADPSPDRRAEMAAKVAAQLEQGALSEEELRIARAIIRAMAHDAVERVREAVAEHLKSSRYLPRDVAQALARDVDTVALPILQFSSVLEEEDLIGLTHGADSKRLIAIARRAKVSERLSRALVAAADRAAIVALVRNNGAEIAEATFHDLLRRHGGNPEIDESVAQRPQLPVTVLERLIAAASDQLLGILLERADLPEHLANHLVLQVRERATVGLGSLHSSENTATELVGHLHDAGRLTPSIILRALCVGDLSFVEAAFAALARIPVYNSRLLIHDGGRLGFKSLYDHSGISKTLYPAFRVALDVARDTWLDGGDRDRERHRRRMIERILTQFEDVGADNLEFLMEKLREAAA